MKNIKLIACDIDGVLLEDTFSPILRGLCIRLGQEYTREVERNMFSQTREEAMKFVIARLGIKSKEEAQKIYNLYFEERDKYLASHPSILVNGLEGLMKRLVDTGAKLVCYGGLDVEKIVDEFRPYLDYFNQYVCTNDFRPGIKEIVRDIYKFEYNQVLFIDDVNTVAEAARSLNVPFIGIPSEESWSYQKSDMKETGVKYLVRSINEISIELLDTIDNDVANGMIWK